MTGYGSIPHGDLLKSPADWVSPSKSVGDCWNNPPSADEKKLILNFCRRTGTYTCTEHALPLKKDVRVKGKYGRLRPSWKLHERQETRVAGTQSGAMGGRSHGFRPRGPADKAGGQSG